MKRPINTAGKFWLGYIALVIGAAVCALVR